MRLRFMRELRERTRLCLDIGLRPAEDANWYPPRWQRVALRCKAVTAVILGRYSHESVWDEPHTPFIVWRSGSTGRASWEYGGSCWSEIAVCSGRNWHVHEYDNASV